jgi:glycosyltransferase involved in cell wall biosynthesis
VIDVLHLITDLEIGGAETMLRNVVMGMDRSRFRNRVVSMTALGPIGEELRSGGVNVECLGMRRGAPDVFRLGKFVGMLRRERPDVLQTWLYHADLFGTMASRLSGIRRLVWNIRCSTMEMSQYNFLSRATRRTLVALSSLPTGVIVNSQAGRETHQALGYHPRRWVFLPNGFDTEQFRPDPEQRTRVREELGVAPDVPLVGTIGRFDPMKDYETFLDMAAIVAQGSDAHFVLAGSGLESSNSVVLNWVRARGLTERCHLLGPRRDIARLDAAFDVFCSSSIGEGFPNVIGEAMSCATPCVATDVGDSAAVIGETGRIVPPRDAAAFATAVHELLEMNAERKAALGAAARERIVQKFSIGGVVRQYEELYTELTSGTPAVLPG